jgi:hypothetical protein
MLSNDGITSTFGYASFPNQNNNGQDRFYCGWNGSFIYQTDGVAINTTTWERHQIEYDNATNGGTVKIYKDGNLMYTGTNKNLNHTV